MHYNVSDVFVGEDLSDLSRVILFCLYVISTVTGLCGSALIIFTLVSDKKFRQESSTYTAYLSNLVATDLFYQLYFFPTLATGLLIGRYPVADHTHCIVNGFVFFVSSIVFLFTLAAISFDRYLHICHSALYFKYFSRKTSTLTSLGLWLLAGLLCLSPAVDGTIGFDSKTHMCFLQHRGAFTLGHAVTVVVMVVTSVGMSIPNALIFCKYRAVRRRIAPGIENGGQSTNTGTNVERGQEVTHHDIALLRSLLTVFMAFFVLTFPATVVFIIRNKVHVPSSLYGFFIWLYAVNSSINGIIYGVMNSRFRKGYKRAFTKLTACCKGP